ncbi:hypothetical protein H6G52_07595 [Limnothrix sp. FACHB-881]|uniref:hypothetical protein n=1 Tax=Limnothrix sp. FACHB-881 TaxID=2692819 RepID=UPI001687C3E5|nr:hypothetical protein [Limnothrix sp. FACHB-881]MBD2635217.1 hypothetical protein [Limnothrix sp. FACHB-881]
MSVDWKVNSADTAAQAMGGEVLDLSNEFRDDYHVLVYRCPDGRVIVFEDWWFRVSEFANEETFQRALAGGNEDYPFDLELANKQIRLE